MTDTPEFSPPKFTEGELVIAAEESTYNYQLSILSVLHSINTLLAMGFRAP
jgi:hypothetical protein